ESHALALDIAVLLAITQHLEEVEPELRRLVAEGHEPDMSDFIAAILVNVLGLEETTSQATS
ncbi:hypothetical protein FOL47_004323, partial [Perkinsus chesapeaki]